MHHSRTLAPLKVAALTRAAGVVPAGCSSVSSPRSPTQPTSRGTRSVPWHPDDVRSWLQYDRAADYESIQSKVKVPTRDGTELDCNLIRPRQDGQADPAKYPGTDADSRPIQSSTQPPAITISQNTVTTLMRNVRGSGDSGGEFPSWFEPFEPEDNFSI